MYVSFFVPSFFAEADVVMLVYVVLDGPNAGPDVHRDEAWVGVDCCVDGCGAVGCTYSASGWVSLIRFLILSFCASCC
jgi:hypothetical protein